MTEQERKPTLLETLDELIFQMNNARSIFVVLGISSIILAPIAIVVAAFFLVHHLFLRTLIIREPLVGILFPIYLVFTVIMSAIWLIVGLREYRFLSKWNQRFRSFLSLKERIDKELQEGGPKE